MTTLLLLHGWGLDASLWDAVLAALPGVAAVRLDRGYFGRPAGAMPAGRIVAVGHSLGALLLAKDLPADVPLVALNGFDRFVGEGAVPPRLVARMRMRFEDTPGAVLADFRARIHAPPAPQIADAGALADDLALLADASAPANGRRIRLIHGADDPLLPPAMCASTFTGAERETVAGAGHLLPLTHPALCADRIATWL